LKQFKWLLSALTAEGKSRPTTARQDSQLFGISFHLSLTPVMSDTVVAKRLPSRSTRLQIGQSNGPTDSLAIKGDLPNNRCFWRSSPAVCRQEASRDSEILKSHRRHAAAIRFS
jgi:hypothetical protein